MLKYIIIMMISFTTTSLVINKDFTEEEIAWANDNCEQLGDIVVCDTLSFNWD